MTMKQAEAPPRHQSFASDTDRDLLSDSVDLRRRTRGWLGAIAQNLFRDQLRAATRDPLDNSAGIEALESFAAAVADVADDDDILAILREKGLTIPTSAVDVARAESEITQSLLLVFGKDSLM